MDLNGSYTGGCLCGAVRFRAKGEPVSVGWCHCSSCRKHTGAPASCYADYNRHHVEFTKGRPAQFQSSPGVMRGFCAGCGSTLTFEEVTAPDMLFLHIGSFDDPGSLRPATSSHTGERLPWMTAT